MVENPYKCIKIQQDIQILLFDLNNLNTRESLYSSTKENHTDSNITKAKKLKTVFVDKLQIMIIVLN